MKNKISIIFTILLFTLVLMLVISNNIYATDLSKIEVTVPVPTIGKTLAKASEVIVKANGSEKFEILSIEWFKYNYSSKEYDIVANTSAVIQPGEKYQILVNYKRPNTYIITESTKITVNGNNINKDILDGFNPGSWGDATYDYDGVCYKFGEAKVQKNLSKIEIIVPEPTIGKTLAKASEVTVKADGSEKFEILSIEWFKYNYSSNEYKTVTNTSEVIQPGEKYQILVSYKRPNKYGITSSTNITINGNSINKDNIEDFNPGSWGDATYDYDGVCYKFGEAKVQKNLSKIELTVPVPTIGKILAKASEITVKADGNETLEIVSIEWFKYSASSKEYETVKNTSEVIQPGEKYRILVNYKRPNKYGITSSTNITVNGNSINKDNIEDFNQGSWGDETNEYDGVCYKFEETKAQENTLKPSDTPTEDKENNTTQQQQKPDSVKPADKENNSTQQTTKPTTSTNKKPTSTKPTTSKVETTGKKENPEDNKQENNNENVEILDNETNTTVNSEESIILENVAEENIINENTEINNRNTSYRNVILIAVAVLGIVLILVIEIKARKSKK